MTAGLGQAPECSRETHRCEHPVRFVFGLPTPIWVQPVRVPADRQIPQLIRGQHRAARKSGTLAPRVYVIFRPEEIDRASCEAKVNPPLGGRYEEVNGPVAFEQCVVPNRYLEHGARVRTFGEDMSIRTEHCRNTERVPHARCPPLSVSDPYPMPSGDR